MVTERVRCVCREGTEEMKENHGPTLAKPLVPFVVLLEAMPERNTAWVSDMKQASKILVKIAARLSTTFTTIRAENSGFSRASLIGEPTLAVNVVVDLG